MDKNALYKLSYGLYVLTAKEGDKDNGCIIDTAIQAASIPSQVSICVNKSDYTHDMIVHTGEFTISVISKEASMGLFERFGFQSGRDVDKFEGYDQCGRGKNGIYYVTEGTNAYISVKVDQSVDLGSHSMFVGQITDMEVLTEAPSITYEYYLNEMKKRSGAESAEKTVQATTESVVEKLDIIAEKVMDKIFNKDNKEENKMAKWVCPVCGYVHEGDEPPVECPQCHVPGSKFTKQEGELALAAEHEFGVYASTVKNNDAISEEDKKFIFDQLMANFNGECSEVGMYLCMSRVAAREGYPEVAAYWEKAAYEESEHAAKFAEILGSELEGKMTASSKSNLAWRVDCEFGATKGKYDLATCARKNGLDAIADTVMEMAKDEARHGKALKGLLERYFAKEIAKDKAVAAANKAADKAVDVAASAKEVIGDAVNVAKDKISDILKK